MDGMTIGEVARRTGVAVSAIRYCERLGLLPKAPRAGGWRRFPAAVVTRIQVVKTARGLGFTLEDIRVLLSEVAPAQQQTPRITEEGLAYMLQGAQDPSNDDPFAEGPATPGGWIETGPHVMVLPVDPKSLDELPNDPGSGAPFVMFRGTPYAHLMVPIE